MKAVLQSSQYFWNDPVVAQLVVLPVMIYLIQLYQ